MKGSIKYPVYPKDFNVKKSFFSSELHKKINSNIQKTVKNIILKKELGFVSDNHESTLVIDKAEVSVIYYLDSFYVLVKNKGKTKSVPVNTDIIYEPITDMWNAYNEIRFDMWSEAADSKNVHMYTGWPYVLGGVLATCILFAIQ